MSMCGGQGIRFGLLTLKKNKPDRVHIYYYKTSSFPPHFIFYLGSGHEILTRLEEAGLKNLRKWRLSLTEGDSAADNTFSGSTSQSSPFSFLIFHHSEVLRLKSESQHPASGSQQRQCCSLRLWNLGDIFNCQSDGVGLGSLASDGWGPGMLDVPKCLSLAQ